MYQYMYITYLRNSGKRFVNDMLISGGKYPLLWGHFLSISRWLKVYHFYCAVCREGEVGAVHCMDQDSPYLGRVSYRRDYHSHTVTNATFVILILPSHFPLLQLFCSLLLVWVRWLSGLWASTGTTAESSRTTLVAKLFCRSSSKS